MKLNNNQSLTMKKEVGKGFKVVEVNVSYPLENIYAVCTPVQNNK